MPPAGREKDMETIKVYLDNMFLNIPDTAQTRRVKADLYDMMEDKYYELLKEGKPENEAVGIVISEFGNLEELREELGLNGETGGSEGSEAFSFREKIRMVTLEETEDYRHDMNRAAGLLGLGVFCCILSIGMITGLAGFGMPGLTLGICLFFLLVAVGVGMIIIASGKFRQYSDLKKEVFALEAGLEEYLRDEKQAFRPVFGGMIALGVVLCVISFVPLTALALLNAPDVLILLGAGLLFVLVAAGVFLFIVAGLRMGTFQVLLQEGDYSRRAKMDGPAETAYWSAVTVIYLVWSFLSGSWGISWIIWVLAGVFHEPAVRFLKNSGWIKEEG